MFEPTLKFDNNKFFLGTDCSLSVAASEKKKKKTYLLIEPSDGIIAMLVTFQTYCTSQYE